MPRKKTPIKERLKILENYINTKHIKKVRIDLNINTIPIEYHGVIDHASITNNPFNLIFGPKGTLRRNHYHANLDLEILAYQTIHYKKWINNYLDN